MQIILAQVASVGSSVYQQDCSKQTNLGSIVQNALANMIIGVAIIEKQLRYCCVSTKIYNQKATCTWMTSCATYGRKRRVSRSHTTDCRAAAAVWCWCASRATIALFPWVARECAITNITVAFEHGCEEAPTEWCICST